MPNEDFTIKTGVQVDDGGVSQLKSIADELEKTANALQKINNVKFNGDIFSGLTNAGKNIQNVTKNIDKLQKSATNAGKPLGNIGKGTESITSGNSKQFTLLDLASVDVIKSNMESIATSAQSLREALGSEVTSGLMTQINEMLSKKDELQNLANILNANQEALGKAAKATGSKNKNAVSEEYYSKNYQRMYESGISELKSQYPDSDIVGPQIKQLESGMVKFSASIRSANGEWKKLSATINKDGTLSYPEPKGMTPAASVSAEKAFQNIKAGKLDPKNFLNFDQTEAYAQKLNQIFEEAYGKTDKYTAKVEADGQAVISKALPNGEEVTVMQARVDDVKQIISEYEKVAGDAVNVKELVEKSVSSVSAKVSPANQKSTTTSSTPKETTPKYATDKSFTGDLKLLTDTEAEQQIIDKYIINTNKMVNAFTQRQEALDRINKKTPQNTTEQNSLDKYNSTKDNIANNIKVYDTQIQKAVDSFRELQSAKSGIQGIDDVFASGEKNITEWAASVVKGKMSIEEFEKKVSGLKTSIGSIGKIIDPASITDAKGELESYLKEITGIQDITFSGFTEKNGIATLKGTFSDGAKEAQTLTAQLNTMNGQFNTISTSIKPVQSGLSKFFLSWKDGAANLLRYIGTFRIAMQLWSAFKNGVQQVISFDSALAEMRKVSTESVSSLKQFQKESFDVADSVGTTALQVQNSTADFLRLGWI